MNEKARKSWTESLPTLYGVIFTISIVFVVVGYFVEHPFKGNRSSEEDIARLKEVASLLAGYIHFEGAAHEYFERVMAHLITEIGVAGLVACGIGITIENVTSKESSRTAFRQRQEFREASENLAREERRNIKNDVFRAVFGNLIPKAITDEIISQVLKSKFVREKVSMNYVLSPAVSPVSGERYIRINLEMSYDILNITNERAEFPLGATVQAAPVEEFADEAKFTGVVVTGSEEPFTLNDSAIPVEMDAMRVKLKLQEHKVILPAEGSARIVIRSQTVKHLHGGSSYFLFGYHSCDLELSVRVMEEPLEIYAETFSENHQLNLIEHDPATRYYKWKTDRPLLAFQGVVIAWVPAAPEAEMVIGSPPSPAVD